MKFKTSLWNGQPARYIQLKMDGNYTRIATSETGKVKVTTSIGTDITQKCKWASWLRPHYERVPHGTVVLGELYVPDHPSSDVKTAIKERWANLKFAAFAVESMDELAPLEDVAAFCAKHGIEFVRWRLVKEGDTVEQLMANIPHGAEGYVLKDANMFNWYKLKPTRTVDAVVRDFIPGNGKYAGQVGSIVVAVEGIDIASVSGMTDEVRTQISNSRANYLGMVCEIHYQGVGSQGRLRHPRFMRWRDDKTALECTLDQDPDLEEYWRG